MKHKDYVDSVITLLKSKNNSIEVFLAGGAVRDADLGKKISDFDFYVVNNRRPNYIYYDDRLKYLKSVFGESVEINHKGYDKLGFSFDCYNLKYKNKNIDVIFTARTALTEVLKDFDLGICKIGYTTQIGIFKTEEYLEDVKNKTITVYLDSIAKDKHRQHRCLTYHLPKVHNKYPEYSCRIKG